jgi:hypothetical protein
MTRFTKPFILFNALIEVGLFLLNRAASVGVALRVEVHQRI